MSDKDEGCIDFSPFSSILRADKNGSLPSLGNLPTFVPQAFADLDTDRSGLMNPSTVRQVLSEFALRLSDDHFNQLWNKFDRNGSGLVSYKDLMRHFTGVDAQDGSNTMKEVSPRIDDANNNEMVRSLA